jgi:twitching motility protein PilT
VRNLIREGKLHQIPSMMQTGQRVGMQTFDMGVAELLKRGLIEPSAVPPKPAAMNGGAAPGAGAAVGAPAA